MKKGKLNYKLGRDPLLSINLEAWFCELITLQPNIARLPIKILFEDKFTMVVFFFKTSKNEIVFVYTI